VQVVAEEVRPAKFEGKGLAGIAKKFSKEEIAEKAKKISEKLDKNPDKKDGVIKKGEKLKEEKPVAKLKKAEEKETPKPKKADEKKEEKSVEKSAKKVATPAKKTTKK
jgi:hypothetical protein